MNGVIEINKKQNITGPRTDIKKKISSFWNKYGIGYLFLMPSLTLFAVFTVIPVITAIGISFTNYNMINKAEWLGISNYRLLFTEDEIFLTALSNTMIFALVSGPAGYIMSFLAAWVINQLIFKRGFALAFYAPSITSGVAMSVVWLWFFQAIVTA